MARHILRGRIGHFPLGTWTVSFCGTILDPAQGEFQGTGGPCPPCLASCERMARLAGCWREAKRRLAHANMLGV
jgi:hypothetical protein